MKPKDFETIVLSELADLKAFAKRAEHRIGRAEIRIAVLAVTVSILMKLVL